MPMTPPQVRQLERVREDVAVRPSQLVRERDHRPRGRLVRVGLRRCPARKVVADPLPAQLLQQQARYVPATVYPDVDDQPVPVILDQEGAVKFSVAVRAHVGYM